MIGQQLGHYKIVSQIGRGGMATVYLAEQVGLDRPVALKVLHPSLAADDVIVRRFQQEARIAANLQHPHIVTIHDVGQSDGVNYIAMRYVDGESLGQLLRREGPFTPTRAVALLAQLADALDFAHARGVLHRDIKPANVMVEPGDLVTLTDFGIARAGESSQLTATRMVIGTPEYMSPEQARGDPVDKRSDLYALGILLYEMLGGRPPFSAASTPSLLYLHVHEPPPPLHVLRPGLPQALCDVVSQALAKNPDDRFQSGAALVTAARAALAVRPPPVPTPTLAAAVTAGVTAPTGVTPSQATLLVERPTAPAPSYPPAGSAAQPIAPPGGRPTPTAARAETRRLTTPTPPAADRTLPGLTAVLPASPTARGAGSRLARRWLAGTVLVVIVLIAIRLLVADDTGLLGRTTPTPAPTLVAAAPTSVPTADARPTEPAPSAVPPTAAARPTEQPPTPEPPTPAPRPTLPPPTPGPVDRLTAAQGAVTAGDFSAAIAELEAVRQDPLVQADPKLLAMANDSLRMAHVLYGNQLLDRGQLDESYAQFGAALGLAPNDPQATDGQKRVVLTKNYGIMEATWGKDDERAIQALEENMLLDPAFRDTRQKLYALLIAKADRLLGNGDRDDAFPVLMRAIEVVPDAPEARQRLATYTPTPTPPPPPPTPVPYVPPPPRPQPQPQPQPQPRPQPQPQPQPQPPGPFVPPGAPV